MVIILILPLLTCVYLNFNTQNFKLYGLYKINDDSFLTNAGCFAAFANSVSKILAGYLID